MACYGCGIGVPRPSLAPYVRVTGSTKGRSSPEALDLRETRSNSHIPTVFPHRFPANSHALTSVEGSGTDEMDSAIQTTSTSKVRRVDFGGCGPNCRCGGFRQLFSPTPTSGGRQNLKLVLLALTA